MLSIFPEFPPEINSRSFSQTTSRKKLPSTETLGEAALPNAADVLAIFSILPVTEFLLPYHRVAAFPYLWIGMLQTRG